MSATAELALEGGVDVAVAAQAEVSASAFAIKAAGKLQSRVDCCAG